MMQAFDYHPPHHHPQHHHHSHHHHPHSSYLTPDASTNGFSRGSSSFTYQQDYRYFVDRGELASTSTTNLVDTNTLVDATGIGFAGNHFIVPPEDISVVYPTWNWSPPTTVVGGYPEQQPQQPQQQHLPSAFKSQSVVCSPTAQLPTPAAMAVLLNPNARSSEMPPDDEYEGSVVTTHHAMPRPIRPVEPVVAVHGVPDSPSREKKHACTMCHKRFDRPSTLRKHLLVHTGEKAFVCETCGRRFGVASNLNRHVKRCILKPVNSPSSSHKSTSGSPSATSSSPLVSPPSSQSTPTPPHDNNATAIPRTGKRARLDSSPADNASSASCSTITTPGSASTSVTTTTTTTTKPPGQKRRRRAPSPSQWIPGTLQNFNLHSEDFYRATTVPLPPVRRNLTRGEERNSWDENVNHAPYHPGGWNGILPGPGVVGLGGKDVRNMNMGFGGRNSGFMLGRVLVF